MMMRTIKLPTLIVLLFLAAGMLVVLACGFLGLGTSQTPTPEDTTQTVEGDDQTIDTDTPEAALLPLEMTQTAFAGRLHSENNSTLTLTRTPTPARGTNTPTLTRGTPPTPTRTRTLTYSAAWYYTSTLTRTPTRGPGTLTQIKSVTLYHGTQTGQALTYWAEQTQWIADVGRTNVYSTTQAALTTLTRTAIAKTAVEQTIDAQIITQQAYVTQTEFAKTAINRITQTADYWPNQTVEAGIIQPTYALTPSPVPPPNPNYRVAYTGSLSGAPHLALMVKGISTIELWAFISGSFDANLCDVSPDGRKLIFEMNNKLYLVYPKDTVSRVDLIENQDYDPALSGLDSSAQNIQAAFSPDGQWIVFRRISGSNTGLYMFRLDGSDMTRLTNDPGYESPDWSTDGNILFLSNGGTLYTLNVSIKPPLAMPAPLPTPVSLSVTGNHAHFIGSKVVFEQSGKIKIANFSANPNTLSIITWTNPDGSMPGWSSDGSKILYVGSDGKIYQIPSSGTSPAPTLVPDTSSALNPHWMP